MSSQPTITAQHVLQAVLESQRLGLAALQQLEAQEPELAEFVMEGLSQIQRNLLELGVADRPIRPLYRQIETLCLTCIASVRNSRPTNPST